MTIAQRHAQLRRRARLYLAVWWLPGAAMVARELLQTTMYAQKYALPVGASHESPEARLASAAHVALLTDCRGRYAKAGKPDEQARKTHEDARAELRAVLREGRG